MQHKWAKEIKAWADGAEIEARFYDDNSFTKDGSWTEWENMDSTSRFSEEDWWEYRIKPQPKEPQYLYAYLDYNQATISLGKDKWTSLFGAKYIGKIKLEDE